MLKNKPSNAATAQFVKAPERRDSWRAKGSLEEQRLLRVTNDDLQE